jgi:uncharacterized protein
MKRLAACLAIIVAAGLACAATDTDRLIARLQPRGYVSDFAAVLSRAERQQLEQLLAELEQATRAQVAVVTVRSMEGGEINDFANRLFERWGIGLKGRDNGVLLLAALQERKARIEVGYGLEGVIPDGRAGRILDEHVIPRFREGRYGEGLAAGGTAIAGLIAADAGVRLSIRPAPPRPARARRQERAASWLHILVLIIVIPVIIRHPWLLLFLLNSGGRGGYSSGGFGRGGFGGFGGGLSGGGGASRGW